MTLTLFQAEAELRPEEAVAAPVTCSESAHCQVAETLRGDLTAQGATNAPLCHGRESRAVLPFGGSFGTNVAKASGARLASSNAPELVSWHPSASSVALQCLPNAGPVPDSPTPEPCLPSASRELAQCQFSASPSPQKCQSSTSPVLPPRPVKYQSGASGSSMPEQSLSSASPVPEQYLSSASPVPVQCLSNVSPLPVNVQPRASQVSVHGH